MHRVEIRLILDDERRRVRGNLASVEPSVGANCRHRLPVEPVGGARVRRRGSAGEGGSKGSSAERAGRPASVVDGRVGTLSVGSDDLDGLLSQDVGLDFDAAYGELFLPVLAQRPWPKPERCSTSSPSPAKRRTPDQRVARSTWRRDGQPVRGAADLRRPGAHCIVEPSAEALTCENAMDWIATPDWLPAEWLFDNSLIDQDTADGYLAAISIHNCPDPARRRRCPSRRPLAQRRRSPRFS